MVGQSGRHQSEPDPVEGTFCGGELGDDVTALAAFFHHALNPSDLALKPSEAFDDVFAGVLRELHGPTISKYP